MSINSARENMKKWVTGAVIATILLVAQTVLVVNALTDFIVGLLGLGGAGALVAAAIQYVNSSNNTYYAYTHL